MRGLLVVAIVVGLVAWRGGLLADEIDDSVLRAGGPDPCALAERCLAVYLSPWCPQCNASHDLVDELRRRAAESRGRVGVKVIVGRDSESALEEYAHEIGGTVFFDDDGRFWSQVGGGVPAWVTWDRDGRILETLHGRPVGGSTHALGQLMTEEMGLTGHL